MELRRLGTSDLNVSSIIFGAMPIGGWLWGGAEEAVGEEVIRAALDAGITTIDTAPVYGFGLSEQIVGRAVRGRRETVIVATKTGMRWDRTDGTRSFETRDERTGEKRTIYLCLKRQAIIEECEYSLKRLETDYIDLYQCHWPDETTPLDETMEAMLRLVEQGKVRHVGVSNFTPSMMEECLRHGPVVSDQPRYNLIRREIEADVLPFCRKRGLGLIVYNPLEMGLLTGKVTMDRTFDATDQRSHARLFRPENRKRVLDCLDKVRPIAERHGMTLAQLAISWVIGEPGISAAIVGARTPEQVRENAKAAQFRLSAAERAEVRRVFEGFAAL
jgi:aryl-alcohol dehydrogenase-like predicted oxidoreductase